jgi:hypothetical protein
MARLIIELTFAFTTGSFIKRTQLESSLYKRIAKQTSIFAALVIV